MSWFEVDIFKKTVEIDLHRYSTGNAIKVSREKIREAYDHGFMNVTLIHGAANIRNKKDGGSIKFKLRSMLRSGELDKWVDRRDSRVSDESMKLKILKNPAPLDVDWKEIPPEDY